MKTILKKNQIMITALAIMIAVAGYLNFAGNRIGEENLAVTSTNVENATEEVADATTDQDLEPVNAEALDISDEDMEQAAGLTDIESLDEDIVEEGADLLPEDMEVAGEVADASVKESNVIDETPGEAVFTSSKSVGSLANAKLIKEQTRSKNKETLLEVINNTNIESAQKQDAINEMIAITDIAEKEMSAEILLEAKGFKDAVVSISDGYVDVCVSTIDLTDAKRAQIEDIVKRKTGISAENIIITPI